VLGVSSAGSGALIAVGLIVVYRLTPRRVVGTDVAHAAILLWVAALAHLLTGNVDLGLTANLLAGSLPGVWIGSAWSARVPASVLRPTLGIVLCGASLGLVAKAGVGVPAPAFAAIPVALGVVAWWVPRARDPGRSAAARRTLPAADVHLPSA
jgi:uncharacterized membrane protein YfcA